MKPECQIVGIFSGRLAQNYDDALLVTHYFGESHEV
jgi:hypothetical protein